MELFDLMDFYVFDSTKQTIKLFEAFSGIGTQSMALKKITDNYEIVGYSEIDKYAIESYKAIHGEHIKNYGDISKIEQLPKCDICTWSFPCQDISLAGNQKGMVEGTRSNYGFEYLETVKRSTHKPTVLIMENVKALVSDRFKEDFNQILETTKSMGYVNHWAVLNAKHYGVAQNRERVFLVSIMNGDYFHFPSKIKLKKRLKDYLESEVDEKYYLSDKQISQINEWKSQQNPIDNARTDKDKTLQCITAKSNTSMNASMLLIKENLRIRKLTPLECWRFMGIHDQDYHKAAQVVSNTQLYKQAGNAIVVDVIEAILRKLIKCS
jgi:DNA (cytosine-5)-methyltransferase 1